MNATRSPYDLHRLNDPFLTDFTHALNEAKQDNSAAVFASADQAGAQIQVEQARTRLTDLLRNGYYTAAHQVCGKC